MSGLEVKEEEEDDDKRVTQYQRGAEMHVHPTSFIHLETHQGVSLETNK